MAGLKGLKKQRRIQIVALAFVALAASFVAFYWAAPNALQYFRSPTQVLSEPPAQGEVFRIGGLVKVASIVKGEGVRFIFVMTDTKTDIPVSYVGNDLKPDLFEEGKGAVATGEMMNGVFQASNILAKHDESYMPKEVIDALKEQGVYVEPTN